MYKYNLCEMLAKRANPTSVFYVFTSLKSISVLTALTSGDGDESCYMMIPARGDNPIIKFYIAGFLWDNLLFYVNMHDWKVADNWKQFNLWMLHVISPCEVSFLSLLTVFLVFSTNVSCILSDIKKV